MELAFNSKPLRSLCENAPYAQRELGEKVGEMLKHRLADLRASATVEDVLVGNKRVTSAGDMTIDLVDGYRLVFSANHLNNPKTNNNALDWAKVTRIKILSISK